MENSPLTEMPVLIKKETIVNAFRVWLMPIGRLLTKR